VNRRNQRYAEEIREGFGETAALLTVGRCSECGMFVGWLASVHVETSKHVLLWHHVTPNIRITELDPEHGFEDFKPSELDPVQARVRTRALDDQAAGPDFLVDWFAPGVGALPLVKVGRADPDPQVNAWCRRHGERHADATWIWELVQSGAEEVRF
jgi:hypothetical protein